MSRYEIEEEVARRDRDYRNHLIEKMNTERMNINSIKPTIRNILFLIHTDNYFI